MNHGCHMLSPWPLQLFVSETTIPKQQFHPELPLQPWEAGEPFQGPEPTRNPARSVHCGAGTITTAPAATHKSYQPTGPTQMFHAVGIVPAQN